MFDLSHFLFPLSLICFSYPLSFEYWLRVFFVGLFAVWPIYMYFYIRNMFSSSSSSCCVQKAYVGKFIEFHFITSSGLFCCLFFSFVFATTKLNIFHIVLLFFLLYFTMFCSLECNCLFLLLICFDEGYVKLNNFYFLFFKCFFLCFAGRMFSFRLVSVLSRYLWLVHYAVCL